MDFVVKLFDIPFVGEKIFKNFIVKHEGGPQVSPTLRKYAKVKYKVDVGDYSYGSCFSKDFNVGGSVSIGRYCSFGPNVRYFGANHPMNYVSMSPYFYQKSWANSVSEMTDVSDISRHHLNIGHDCWVGYGTIITCNCKSIGNGAVIGAGSVVTKDVAPYSIVAGNPARIIRYRFEEETVQLLESSKWYEYEPGVLLDFYNLIDNPREFVKALNDIKLE